MEAVLDRLIGFIAQNTPSWRALVMGGPPAVAWSFAALWLAGRLQRRGARTGYTRKVFHFLIFSTVALLEWRLGTPAVCLFGAACSAAVLIMSAVARLLAGAASSQVVLGNFAAAKVLGIAAASAAVEAVSPHRWDNFTMQVVPSALAWAWLA